MFVVAMFLHFYGVITFDLYGVLFLPVLFILSFS